MPRKQKPMSVSFSLSSDGTSTNNKPIRFAAIENMDGSPTATTDKSLLEIGRELNPDASNQEIQAALGDIQWRVHKTILRNDYERLKNQAVDDMTGEDREKWSFIRLIFSDEIGAESDAHSTAFWASIEAQEKQVKAAKRLVTREIAIAETIPDPIFMLNLPDEYLLKLAESGFTTIGQILFSIKINREHILDAYIAENDENTAEKFREYLRLTKVKLPEIVGASGYALIGSRLLQFGYMTRDEFKGKL